MENILKYYKEIVLCVTGFITIASVIVKLTPNKTDNKILFYFIKVCEKLAMNNKPVEEKNENSSSEKN